MEADDVDAALAARRLRHDYPEQRLRESIAEGERLITLHGEQVGQINGLTQIDLGDWRFGLPVRVSARTHAGSGNQHMKARGRHGRDQGRSARKQVARITVAMQRVDLRPAKAWVERGAILGAAYRPIWP